MRRLHHQHPDHQIGVADPARAKPSCCHRPSGGSARYKARQAEGFLTVAMYVDGLGTLTARQTDDGRSLDFDLRACDPFFLDSFRDGAPSYEVSYAIWEPVIACGKLSDSRSDVASVPTFTIGGREYVNTAVQYSGSRCERVAWALTSLADWRGPTFSGKELFAAYDAGTLQRGDHRGHLVRVRGTLCVMESYAQIFDNNGRAIRLPDVDEEGGEDEFDAEALVDEEDVEE